MAPPIRLLNPSTLQDPTPGHYSHVAVTEPGFRSVYLAGQIGVDKAGKAAEGLEAQARQALANVKACLAEAGATVRNITHVTIFIVDYDAATCPVWGAFREFLTDEQGTYCPPGTLVPVPALASPEFKIEVQCVAAVRSKSTPVKTATNHSMVDVDVVVVGAGLSGLQAATDVQNAGLSCVVLEAKDRVGGKTHSIRVSSDDNALDVGAAWINDKTQPKMNALYKRFGCEGLVQRVEGDGLFRAAGLETRRTPYSEGSPPIEATQAKTYEDLYRALDRDAAQINIFDSTANAHIDDISLGEYFRRHGATPGELPWVLWCCWIRALTGCEPDNIGLVYFLDYVKSGGGLESLLTDGEKGAQYLRNRKGNQSISIGLAGDLLPGTVHLDTPVTRITQIPTGCLVDTHGSTTFRCRKVLLSISTPLYRHVEFSPALPPAKLELANATHLGAYSKCIMVYARPWWREYGLNASFSDLAGPIAFSRDVSSDADGVFAIACFLFGEYAVTWARLNPTRRLEVVQQQLVDMVTAAAGGDADKAQTMRDEILNTTQVIEKQWIAEQWCEGAPCPMLPPGGLWARLGNELRRPAGNLHFIGTETAYAWKGYMEGAVRAGERGAKEVIEALKGPQERPVKL